MSRFFYYLILVVMIENIIAPVPRILLLESKNGAIIAMIIAIIVGLAVTYIIVTMMNQFPDKGFPELLKAYTPKWFSYPILLFMALTWYVAGLITLMSFTYMLLRFLEPKMSVFLTLVSLLLVVIFGVMLKTRSIAATTEIILILTVPILFFLFIKAYTSPEINIDFIKVALMHANRFPSYDAFSSSLYIFMGGINIIIFNRYFIKKQVLDFKRLFIIGSIGIFILITTYFIPIGFNGFDEIGKFAYPWVSTSDTIRMKFGIIERVIYIFLISYLLISSIAIIIYWHITIQLLGSIIYFKHFKWKETNLTPYVFIILIVSPTIWIIKVFTDYQVNKLAIAFYNTLPILYFLIIISLIAIKRGAKS